MLTALVAPWLWQLLSMHLAKQHNVLEIICQVFAVPSGVQGKCAAGRTVQLISLISCKALWPTYRLRGSFMTYLLHGFVSTASRRLVSALGPGNL